MKTFKHKLLVDTFTTVDNSPIVGIQPCPNRRQCEKFYRNFHEMCGGYQILVDWNPLSDRKTKECPCCGHPHDAHLLQIKDYIK